MSEASQDTPQPGRSNWYDCAKIFGTFRMARQASKIALALAALILTLLWGSILDRIWIKTGDGVANDAIASYIAGAESAIPRVEKLGDKGVYQVYSVHWRGQIHRMFHHVIPSRLRGGGHSGPVQSMGGICQGTAWLLKEHPWYSLLFFPVVLLIWSLFGGMICRIAAVEFARGEVISLSDAYAFVRKKYWGGFFLAPLTPLLWMLVCAIMLVIGGLFFSIPFLGNTLGALFFFLALLAGVAGAVLLVGFTVGGSLLWPAIAVEGTTSFDAFSTSFHYVYTRPWRSAFYGIVAFAYGGVCWIVVNFFAHLALWFAHAFVGLGTVASRTGDVEVSKLDAIWSYERLLGPVHNWMQGAVGGLDYLAVILVGLWVYLLIAVVWAFLFSYYFCASTVVYFLLRRAVDLTDYERVEEIEEYKADEVAAPEPAPQPSAGGEPAAPDTSASARTEPAPAPEPKPESEPPPSDDEPSTEK